MDKIASMSRVKGILSILLVLSFSLLLLCGCNKGKEQTGSGNKDTTKAAQDDISKAIDNIGKKDQWPKDKLPKNMPQLTSGKIINWGEPNGEVIIKMEKVSHEALEEYKTQLQKNGWRVSDDASSEINATYDLYNLSIDYNKDGDVQLWLSKVKEVAWPSKLLPQDFPKFEKGKVTDAREDKSINLVYISIEGAAAKDAVDYAKLLMQKGWEGDASALENSPEKFNIQLSKGNMFLDFDFYENADGFTLQLTTE